jgi:hypothetical protein
MQNFLTGRSQHAAEKTARPAAASALGFHPLVAPALASAAAERAEPAPTADEMEPRVELVQTEGQIRRIVVTCACCRRIELECEYPA